MHPRNGKAIISPDPPGAPAVGQLLRSDRLGTTCLYRVQGYDGPLVVLEVVDAPGLDAGRHFRFTGDAVAAMAPVNGHSTAGD